MNILYVPKGECQEPTRGSAGAAGWDLYSAENVLLWPYEAELVPCNLNLAIPPGHMLLVLPRSGNALKKQIIIPNSPGLIDEDYRGELKVILTYIPRPILVRNNGMIDFGCEHPARDSSPLQIKKGDRIAQAVLVPYVTQQWVKVDTLPPTTRGEKGFGSSGA